MAMRRISAGRRKEQACCSGAAAGLPHVFPRPSDYSIGSRTACCAARAAIIKAGLFRLRAARVLEHFPTRLLAAATFVGALPHHRIVRILGTGVAAALAGVRTTGTNCVG